MSMDHLKFDETWNWREYREYSAERGGLIYAQTKFDLISDTLCFLEPHRKRFLRQK